ncbi:MAG: cytochrome c oxidase subunit 2A [Lachnospiraceae bacterium]|nr:cytochrome c oxidase subunit 2A [Lachnospiraceae bacterium]
MHRPHGTIIVILILTITMKL